MYEVYVRDLDEWVRTTDSGNMESEANILAHKRSTEHPDFLYAVIRKGSCIPLSIFQEGRQYIWPMVEISP
jgi:hypothetical protein